jgi:hypothetical protein
MADFFFFIFVEESVGDSLTTSPVGLSVWPVCILNYYNLFLCVIMGITEQQNLNKTYFIIFTCFKFEGTLSILYYTV